MNLPATPRPLAGAALLLAAATLAAARAAPPGGLVLSQAGQLPIILSAPHGGQAEVPGVPERKGEGLAKGPSGFVKARDTGTDLLAAELAAAIEAKLGKKPYFVVAKFHRKFIDANRPATIAYEHPQAKPTYDAYHAALARHCRDVQQTFGRGLLLDVHGQGTARDTVFRGTKNGTTVKLLVQRYGPAAHVGPHSFFGLLGAQGIKGHPTDDGKEQSGFTGGYIVQTYGSHTAFGIDAIQLEFGADYRSRDAVKGVAKKLAEAVAEYAKRYLPAEPLRKAS